MATKARPIAPRTPDVVTLGECMAVIYPRTAIGLERATGVLLNIAGSEANTAIGLARLGIGARFISRVGEDPFGRRIREVLTGEHVDTRYLTADPTAPTGVFFREWLKDGARRVYYYRAGSAASRLGPEDLRSEAFAGAKIVHLSGITPALSGACAAAVRRAIELAHEVGALVSFDPNYRASLWDPAAARATLTALIPQADLLLMGDEDARVIFDTDDHEAVLQRAAGLGPKIIVLKRAARGAAALVDGKRFQVRARPVKKVVDPVGAGDGFNAGFLAGLLRGHEAQQCLELGAEIGAKAVGKLGDYAGYPTGRPTGGSAGRLLRDRRPADPPRKP